MATGSTRDTEDDDEDYRAKVANYGNTADPFDDDLAISGDPNQPMKIPVSLLGDRQQRPQSALNSSDMAFTLYRSAEAEVERGASGRRPVDALKQPPPQPAPQPALQSHQDDSGVSDPQDSYQHLLPPHAPMGYSAVPPMMPMFSGDYLAIANQFNLLAAQAANREQEMLSGLGGCAPGVFPPGMPPYFNPWQSPYGGFGNVPNAGQFGKGHKKGGKIFNVGQGRGQGGRHAAMQAAQPASANQNNAAAPKGPAVPQVFTWSAPVYEKHANDRTYVDGIIFHAALDRKLLQETSEAKCKIGTDSWMKHFISLKDLDTDKVTTQDGREMTYEEWCRVREASKKTQSKSAPEGNLSKEEQQAKVKAKVKIHSDGKGPVELSYEEVSLLRCKLRMKDGKEIMSVPNFFSLSQDERKARLPVQVHTPQCAGQVLKTTVMIRNIPNDYERDHVRDLLNDKGFRGRYDFVYVPADYKHKTGLGYAFVNMGNSKAVIYDPAKTENEVCHGWAVEVWEKLDGFKEWKTIGEKKSSKECEVTWGSSEHQGKQHHIDRYRDSPVMHPDNKSSYKPAIFDDDGEIVPFPAPVKALRKPRTKKQPRTGCTSPSPSHGSRSEVQDDGKDNDANGKGTDAGSGGGPGDGKT